MKRIVILIAIILSVIGCKKPKPNVEPTIYYVGDTITLKYGECREVIDTIANSNRTYKVCLDSIKEDRVLFGGCPYSYPGGFATISIKWMGQGIDTVNISLKLHGCCRECGGGCGDIHSSLDTLGYQFCFLLLVPYPDSSNFPIPPDVYTAKIKIDEL